MRSWIEAVAIAVIAIGMAGEAHALPSAAQQPPHSAQTLLISREEFERLGVEVRAALSGSPGKPIDERYGNFVALQAARGDVEGARESARQAGGWYPFARVAIAQYRAGDHDGAIATTRMAATVTERARAFRQLSVSLHSDQALALARAIESPKDIVDALRRSSRSMYRTDTAGAMALLSEAIGIAQRDTSPSGAALDVELAYDQAERGDLSGALRIISDTLEAGVRAERLGRIAASFQGAPVPGARIRADSLFREALRAVDDMADSARRAERRALIFWHYATIAGHNSADVLLAESRTPAERALIRSAPASPSRSPSRLSFDGPDSTRLRQIGELEASGQFRVAADEIHQFLRSRHFGGIHRERVEAGSVADTLARRAIANAMRVSEGFADSTRLRLVIAASNHGPDIAGSLAKDIVDSTLRSAGMLRVARRTMLNDPVRALAYASTIPARHARDSLFAFAAAQAFDAHPDSGIAIARRIEMPAIRAMAILDLANRAATRGNSSLARALAVEGMPGIHPPVQAADETRFSGLVRAGLYDVLLQWARSQPSPEQRANAFLALYSAVAAW